MDIEVFKIIIMIFSFVVLFMAAIIACLLAVLFDIYQRGYRLPKNKDGLPSICYDCFYRKYMMGEAIESKDYEEFR